jgi:DNA-directed RNA polymerase subunit RPC12/RpoP
MENIKGKFSFSRKIEGEHIALIDDVIATGSTAIECARMLYENGAASVTLIVLGINQYEDKWRSIHYKELKCPDCKGKMIMKFNNHDEKAFFAHDNFKSSKCRRTMKFTHGVIKNNENNDIVVEGDDTDVNFEF